MLGNKCFVNNLCQSTKLSEEVVLNFSLWRKKRYKNKTNPRGSMSKLNNLLKSIYMKRRGTRDGGREREGKEGGKEGRGERKKKGWAHFEKSPRLSFENHYLNMPETQARFVSLFDTRC